MKVLVINGSPNKSEGGTQKTIDLLMSALKKGRGLELETLYLQDLQQPFCDGCLECLKRGDEACAAREKVRPVEEAIRRAEALIVGSPVHSFSVSSQIKTMIDLFVKELHRPSFLGKKAIVVAAASGGGQQDVLKYLRNTLRMWGMDVVGRLGVSTQQIGKPAYDEKLKVAVGTLAQRLRDAVEAGQEPSPTLRDLIGFRVMRTVIDFGREEAELDYRYWEEHGWLDADYFNNAPINPVKNQLAKFAGWMIRRQIETGNSKPIV